MELEHDVKLFPIDDSLQIKVQELVGQGWDLVPGVPPVAIYHVVRVKQQASGGALGKLKIDDSKIMVVPAGERKQ